MLLLTPSAAPMARVFGEFVAPYLPGDATVPTVMQARKPRDEAELLAAVPEFGYELRQCAASVAHLRRGLSGGDVVLHNALVESVVVHLRTLTMFLLDADGQNKSTDIAPVDFTPGHMWTPAPCDSVARLKEGKQDAHKSLAHLTWRRTDGPPGEKQWRFEDLVQRDLFAVVAAWLDHVDKDGQTSVWEALRQQWYPAWYFLNAPHGTE